MTSPKDLRYTKTHEWVRVEGDVATIGITDYAQNELGDITYLELPEVGTQVTQNEPLGVIESVKAASDIYAPVSGEVIERNEQAIESPDLVNRSPYDEAWLVKVRMSNPSELDSLMNADEYDAFAAEAVH
ncbi:MAG: glycine cleavage system protein GcvH [Thermomicrobiales bacterium]|nr:MAG: glycine cleavage system protein GcvH [Thermomicrobiales bacterium]